MKDTKEKSYTLGATMKAVKPKSYIVFGFVFSGVSAMVLFALQSCGYIGWNEMMLLSYIISSLGSEFVVVYGLILSIRTDRRINNRRINKKIYWLKISALVLILSVTSTVTILRFIPWVCKTFFQ